MARTVKTITDAWQQVSAAAAVYSFKKKGNGTLFINTAQDETTAEEFSSDGGEKQAEQRSTVVTYMKHNGDTDWIVVVDE